MALLRNYFQPQTPQAEPVPATALPTGAQAYLQNQQMLQGTAAQERAGLAEESPFEAGIYRGGEELSGSLGAAAGLVQGALGDVAGGRARLRRNAQELQTAQQLAPEGAGTFTEARQNGKLGAYALNQIGALIPGTAATIGTSLATGGVGGLAQAGLRRLALSGAEDVAENVAAGAAKNALGKTVGELAGAGAAGAAQSAGSTAQYVDPNATDAQFQSQSRKALAGAGALGALQAIPSIALMARYGFGEAAALKAAQSVPKSLLGRAAKEATEQGVIGGATNAATVAVDHAVHQWVTGTPQAAPALPDYVNAIAAGAIGGAALGAPAGLFHAAPAGESRSFAENLRAAKNKVGAAIDEQIQKVREPAPNRPKPGEPYPDSAPVDVASKFDENLRTVQDNDDDFHSQLLKDVQPYNIKDGVLNGPAAGLVDPARAQARAALFKTPTERTFASILDDTQYSADAVPGIKASAKAFTDGFDSLNPKQKKAVGDFASRLDPKQLEMFKRTLATANEIVSKGAKITRDADSDTSDIPSYAPNKSRDTSGATPENLGADDVAQLSQNEGEAPLPRGYVDDETWKNATYVGPRTKRGTPDEQNIRLTGTNANGEAYGADLNIMRAASSVAKTPEGRLFIDQNGANRKVNTALAVASDAVERGYQIPPDAFAAGKRLFPGDDGVITPAEAKAIRDRLAQPLRKTAVDETPGRAAPSRPFSGAQSDAIDTAEGDIGGLAAKQAAALGPDAKVNTPRENRALEDRARRAAEVVGIPASAPPHVMFERAQKLPKSPARDALLASVRLLADTDPALASRLEQLEPGRRVVQNEGVKPESAPLAPNAKPNAGVTAAEAAAAKQKPMKLSDVEARVKAHDDYGRNPPPDFTAAEARKRADELDKISARAAEKAKALGEDHPTYQRMDDLRMDAKDAAANLREVAKTQDEYDAVTKFDEVIPAPAEEGKPSTLRESIEKLISSEPFQKIKNAVDVLRKKPVAKGAGGKRDLAGEQRIIDRLAKAFGVDSITVKHASESAEERVRNSRGAYNQADGAIYLHEDNNGAGRVSTLLHEFGHHLIETKLADATREQKNAIADAYEKWSRQQSKSKSTFDVRASRAPVFVTMDFLSILKGHETGTLGEADPRTAAYMVHFDEFMADSIARVLESNEDVQKIIRDAGGGWFARVAQIMKMTYDLARGHSSGVASSPDAVRDWVHSFFHPEEALSASGEPSPPSSTAGGHPPGGTPPPFSTAGGAQPSPAAPSPHDVTSLLGQKERGILEDVFTRRGVIEQLLQHATPDQARDLLTYDTRLETAINLGFKLWAAGQLKLDAPEALKPLRQMSEATLKIFGLPSQRALAEQILSDLKAGNVNSKYSARRVVENKVRAELQKQAAAGSGVAYTRLRTRRAVEKTTKLVAGKLQPVYTKVMADLDSRLRETNVPALRALASLVHLQTGEVGRDGQQPLAQAITQQRSKFWERSTKLMEGLSARDQIAISKALRTKGTLKDAKLEARRAQIASFMKELHDYMTSKGVDVGKIDNYWPVVLEPTKVQNREAAFRAMLDRPELATGMRDYLQSAGWDVNSMSKQDMIDVLFRSAAYKPDYTLGGRSFADTGTAPGGKEFRTRVSEFIYKSGNADAIKEFAQFQSNDLEKVLIPYVSHVVRRAEFINRLGKTRDMKSSTLDQLLARARKEGATPEQIELAKNYVDASLGAYGTGPNPFMQRLTGSFDRLFGTKLSDVSSQQYRQLSNAVIAYQNLRTLGLGIFGNLIDPLGVWTRSSSAGDTWKSYKAAYTAAFKKNDPSYLRDMAHALGTVERHAVSKALAYGYGGDVDNLSTLSSRVNSALFKVNGMESITSFARLAATEAANKFLLRHKDLAEPHSERYLRELGLKPSDVVEDPQHPGYVKLDPKVEKALYQFVDESVLRPVATQRPLWQNDPHFAVLAQYKGYLYSFYNTITKRMLHEAGNGNLKGLAPIAGYLAVSMAAELAREAVQYPNGGNPRRKDWDAVDYLQLAADRSGLAGPRIGALTDSYGDAERGNIPGQSITGPSVAQASELLRVVRGRENTDSAFIHALPGQSLYKGWINGSGGNSGPEAGGQDNPRRAAGR